MKFFAVLVLALFAFANQAEAFTSNTAKSRVSGPATSSVGYSPMSHSGVGSFESSIATELKARKDISNDEKGEEYMDRVLGMNTGMYLGALVLALNIWIFSIPVEFRRTRICNEADTAAFPNRCMTGEMWRNGIADYYKNGKFEIGCNSNVSALPFW